MLYMYHQQGEGIQEHQAEWDSQAHQQEGTPIHREVEEGSPRQKPCREREGKRGRERGREGKITSIVEESQCYFCVRKQHVYP